MILIAPSKVLVNPVLILDGIRVRVRVRVVYTIETNGKGSSATSNGIRVRIATLLNKQFSKRFAYEPERERA